MGAGIGEIRTGRHCVFALHAHLVFVTKYRRNVFRADHLDALERVMRAVCADFGAELREFNGESDHVHLLVTYPPKVALASLVNSLKGVSSRLLRRDFPEIERRYWRGHLWSASYFAGSVGGAPLDVLRGYIEQQRRPAGPSGARDPTGSPDDRWGPFTTDLKVGALRHILGRVSVCRGASAIKRRVEMRTGAQA